MTEKKEFEYAKQLEVEEEERSKLSVSSLTFFPIENSTVIFSFL